MTLEQRLIQVREAIARAATGARRDPGSVRLLAVSKQQSADSIRNLAGLGILDFGESYLQEALTKQAELSDLPLRWHFIGRIQSNKAAAIARHFDWVHSLDRVSTAERLSARRPDELPQLNVCLQVKLVPEPGKAGLDPAVLGSAAAQVVALPRLRLRGLMVLPPYTEVVTEQQEAFARLRELYQALRQQGYELDTLSMGMSGDMETAIAEGATIVRIGTRLFGPRR